MKKIFLIILTASVFGAACKKQLDVKNPNEPTPDAATTESGITSLSQGAVYINGFKNAKYSDGVFGLFWSGAMGFHELLGDVIGAEAANSFLNQIGCPDKVTLDNGTVLLNPNNPNKFYDFFRSVNLNDNQGSNFPYYEWAYMYNMITACNSVLEILPSVSLSGDAAAKTATISAWCHFWKGFAYAHIGSVYYAGIINDGISGVTNGNYVTKEAVIAESNKQFDLAITDLGSAGGDGYDAILSKLIPSFCQVGKGFPSAAEWIKNINTMKARNILVNKTVSDMSAADWGAVLALTNAGLTGEGDSYFTGRTNVNGDFLPTNGTVASRIQSSAPGGGGYGLSERWVQEFKVGDKRKDNNVKTGTAWLGNSDRGNSFNTRYTLYNEGNGIAGVYVYANTIPEAFELPLAGSYEENALMKAEALINTSQIEAGLQLVDAVRDYFGAGLAHVAGTNLNLAQAKEELRRERRVALAFRGLSFYDARRLKYTEPGVGRTGCVVVDFSGNVSTNATIDYGFLDYWDVPDNELAYNPNTGSTVVKNPK